MEEKKTFVKLKDGGLSITVEGGSDLMIPHEGKNVKLGTFKQTTVQSVEKSKIKVLAAFVSNQLKMGKGTLDKVNQELESKLKNVDEKMPENIIKGCTDSIQKGSKAFRKSMGFLQQRLMQIDRKKNLLTQKAHVEKQIGLMEKDHKAIKAAI